MNPDTNKFEELREKAVVDEYAGRLEQAAGTISLFRPNGEPVPPHWTVLRVGERVVVKNYTFTVAHLGESYVILEPAGPVVIGETNETGV